MTQPTLNLPASDAAPDAGLGLAPAPGAAPTPRRSPAFAVTVVLLSTFALLLQAAARPISYPLSELSPLPERLKLPERLELERTGTLSNATPAGPSRRAGRAPSINPNLATMAELDLLPGVGRGLARRIIQERMTRGPYLEAADLERVHGIGPILLQRIRPFLLFAPAAAETIGR